jgi:hypothetical protein
MLCSSSSCVVGFRIGRISPICIFRAVRNTVRCFAVSTLGIGASSIGYGLPCWYDELLVAILLMCCGESGGYLVFPIDV